MTKHPLDSEEIVMTLSLTHTATGTTVSESIIAPADSRPTVPEAVGAAMGHTMDDLLAKIEIQGGS